MRDVEIFEVGPRDGLQNEKRLIPAAEKIALVDLSLIHISEPTRPY